MKVDAQTHFVTFIILCLAISIPNTIAFISHPFPNNHRNQIIHTKLSYSGIDEVTRQLFTLKSLKVYDPIYSQAEHVMNYATQYIENNQGAVEGTMCQYLSHIALDLATFLFPEDTALLHLFNLIGRLFSVSSDYILYDRLRPDELAFQMIMLGVSSMLLTRSIYPLIKVSCSIKQGLPDRRDVIAYRNLFEPVGISWIQYKYLVASGALNWIETESVDYNIFLEKGVTGLKSFRKDQTHNNQSHIDWVYNHDSKSFDAPDNIGELVSIKFGQTSDKQKQNKSFPNATGFTYSQDYRESCAKTYSFQNSQSYIQKPKQKTLLRINTEKMRQVVEDNEDILKSMLFLAIKSLQEKAMDHQIMPIT